MTGRPIVCRLPAPLRIKHTLHTTKTDAATERGVMVSPATEGRASGRQS